MISKKPYSKNIIHDQYRIDPREIINLFVGIGMTTM